MALNVIVGHVAVPGSTGNFDITLAAGFDPKAIIMWTTPNAADGVVAHASGSLGFGTYRGSAVQMAHTTVFAEDNVATADAYRYQQIDALVRLLDGTGAIDLEIDLVSMTTGAGSKVTLNAVNLHTTAGVRLEYMILGGDDLLDAEAHDVTLTTGAGAQDVALGSGFGHPNVVFFSRIATDNSAASAGADVGIGFGILGGDDRGVWWGSQDNAATEASFQRLDSNSALVAGANGTIETDILLAAEAGFPTDGYEVTKTTSSFGSEKTKALALKFSTDVTITSGQGSARTTTGDTDLAVGTSTPKGLLLFHTRQTAADSTDSTSTDAALLGIGMVDGAGNERWAGIWDDDGQASASVASSAQCDDKAIRFYVPSSDALDAEADCTVSGSNFRLTWGDAAPSAFLYNWIAFGEATGDQTVSPNLVDGGATVYSPTVTTGAVTVSPNLVDAGATVFSPTVTSSYSIAANLVDAGPTVYSPTLTTGAVTVSPNLVDGGATVYSPTVAAGLTVEPDLVDASSAVFSPTVTTGAVTITPNLVDAVAMVFSPTVALEGAAAGASGLTLRGAG